jgi:tRNA(Leu) C34 or U34 (ribose-2'-O)-methylase TrmL
LPVVPFRQMAPTSRFEKPSTRVYSSPKPTQPDSSTMGEANFMPRNYHDLARVSQHADLAACLAAIGPTRLHVIETDGARGFHEATFQPGDSFLFGRETSGLPEAVVAGLPPHERLRIPMRPGNRSLNLSNAVAVVVYEAWRQNGFAARD